jgi:ubiquinone/menaquinone biosynthesis C-methylase UbiE
MFQNRSYKLERLDTGDYTHEEYEVCLSELRFINRWIGDSYALRKTLLQEIQSKDLKAFSVLDVGAGSGELLREIAKFGRKTNRQTKLFGLEYNQRSAESINLESKDFSEISSVRGTGFSLPFADNSFDYTICSLFTHHFTDKNVVKLLAEMKRVSSRGIFVIDLHRHAIAYGLYKIFCVAFRISNLVREDGSLSVLRGFKHNELKDLGEQAKFQSIEVSKHFPYRLVLKGK